MNLLFFLLKGFYSPPNLLPTEEVTTSLIEKDNSENASQTNDSISQLSHVESAPVISTRENENSTMNDSDLVASRSLGKQNVRFVSRTFEKTRKNGVITYISFRRLTVQFAHNSRKEKTQSL